MRIAGLTASAAAEYVEPGMLLGLSGFTSSGTPKAVPRALAERFAKERERTGRSPRIRLLAGASTGASVDEALGQVDAIAWRAPYQASTTLRSRINAQQTEFLDIHLSHVPQMVEFGFLGEIDLAIVEVCDMTADGRVYLTTSGGITPTLLRHAKRVIIERNAYHSPRLREMHDIAVLPRPPHRNPLPLTHPLDRVGQPYAEVDPAKVVGIVETHEPDGAPGFRSPGDACERIAEHVARFLHDEQRAGRIPAEFLPLQAGVGNISNAVLRALGDYASVPTFTMYTEVLQDGLIDLMTEGKLSGASTCGLTLTDEKLAQVYDNMDFFASRIVIRPQEISNNPGIIRQLGVIALNTVLEVDIYGCANSTHIAGTQLVHGIGGSGDFVRNAYLSILMTPSTQKGETISSIVPMVSHVDHTEHSIQVIVTEQGLADLRGLGPVGRARRIIDRCAHPRYRDDLHRYLEAAPMGHIRHDLKHCFDFHLHLLEHGSMLSRP